MKKLCSLFLVLTLLLSLAVPIWGVDMEPPPVKFQYAYDEEDPLTFYYPGATHTNPLIDTVKSTDWEKVLYTRTSDIIFASSSDAVASVDAVTGEVTSGVAGEAIITATIPAHLSYFAYTLSYKVVVEPYITDLTEDQTFIISQLPFRELTGITITPESQSPIPLSIAETANEDNSYDIRNDTQVVGTVKEGSIIITLKSDFLQSLPRWEDITLTANGLPTYNLNKISTTFQLPADYMIEVETFGTGSGTVTPFDASGKVSVPPGADQEFTIAADPGSRITSVRWAPFLEIDFEPYTELGAGTTKHTFKAVDNDYRLEVTFEPYTPAPSKPAKAPVLNRKDHFAYMQGYPNGNFGLHDNITRAEVATMFARLCLPKMDESATYAHNFSDVPSDWWCSNYIGFMAENGILTGYPDGTFGPNQPITRGEFAAIASRFDELALTNQNNFSDVADDYWAVKYINSSTTKGWIKGYADGTFKPFHNITRTESVALVNRVLNRVCDKEFVSDNLSSVITFPDVEPSFWAYYDILEAANGHTYVVEDGVETWMALKS